MSQLRRRFAALILITVFTGVAEADGRAIVPVVGSSAGVNGANFRTEMQLHNPGNGVMRGSLMFLPQSLSPQVGELATLGYEVEPKQTVRFADVIASMGASGLGSLDVLPLEGGRPRIVVRAFDDQGNFGTRGLMVPVLDESEAPVLGFRFVLLAPSDVARYRFNIGVRTLGESSAMLRVVEHDAAGAAVGEPITLEFPGETFRQQPAGMLLGREVVAGHTYSFETLSGEAFVYATTVDNLTNDGSLQLDRPVNRPPVVAGAAVTTDVNEPVTIAIQATDPDDDPMTFQITAGPSYGTLSDLSVVTKTLSASEVSVIYTPATDYQGPDMFAVLVSDDVNGRTFANIVLNVGTQTGAEPTAVNDRYTMDEGATLTIAAPGVLANDTDPEGNALVAQLVRGPVSAATFTLNADGSFTYRPRTGFSGGDFFQYEASDGANVSNVARAVIIVNSTNEPPTAVADAAATTEDAAIAINVLTNDSDPEGDPLTVVSVSSAGTLGAVTLGAGGVINYDPTGSAVLQALAAAATRTDTFAYTIRDPRGATATTTVTVTVTGVDDAPLAVADSATLLEDAAATAIAVLANDTDVEGDAFTITSATQGTTGTVVITGGGAGLTYQPNGNACGADSFTYTLNGGSTATVTVTVTCVNDVPLFTKGADVTVLEDSGAFTAGPWATGVSAGPASESGQVLTFSVTNDNNALFSAQPAVDASGNLSFTLAPNANGSAVVTVGLSDDGGTANGGVDTSASQTFNITVTAVNDAPSFVKGGDDTALEDSGLHTVAGWATSMSKGPADESGQTLSFVVTNDNNALFSVQPAVDANGNLNYTLAAGQFGSATVAVTLSDDGGVLNGGVDTSAAQSFVINVANVNDDPTDIALSNATVAEAQPAGTVVGTLSTTDVDTGDTFTYTLVAGAGSADNASFQIAGDSLRTGAVFDFETKSSYSIRVRTTDSAGGLFEEAFAITVTDGNEMPTDIALGNASVRENELSGTAVGNLLTTDPDAGDTHTYTLVAGVGSIDNGSFQISGGQLQTAATFDFETKSSYSVRIRTTDGGGLSYEEAFTITVEDVNDAPTDMALDNATINENMPAATAVGNLSTTNADAGDTLTYTLVAGAGSTDNASFQLNGAQLQSAASFNFEAKSSYTIRIRTTDAGGLFYEEAFIITIVNVPEAPVALPDTFDTIGNTLLEVDAASSEPQPKVYVNGNLLANDVDPDTGTNAGLTTALNTATAGAVVTVNSDGTFTYLPPAGHLAATDSFTYDVSDGALTTTAAVVTIELSERVWYVKNDATAEGNGRSTTPFDTLAEAQTASLANDYIFVYLGNGTATGQDAGILLKNGQRLLGQPVGLDVAITAGTFNGTASPATVNLVAAAGSRPLIDNTSVTADDDAGVAVNATTAAMTGIVIRGLSIRGNENAVDVTSAAANAIGVTISNNTIRGSGTGEGIDVNQGSTAATSSVIVTNNVWDVGGTHPGNAVDIARTAGNLQIAFSGNTNILSTGGTAVNITGVALANTTITDFANNTIHQDTAGSGINISDATFDTVPGAPFGTVSGGATVVGVWGNGVGASGVVLTNVAGAVAFTDLDIFADNGSGLTVTGTGPVSTGLGIGTYLTVGAGVGIVEATGGPAVSLSNMTVALQLGRLRSANSATTGVSLTNVYGGAGAPHVSAGSDSSITNATGTDFAISGGYAVVTYNGTIIDDVGQLVSVASVLGNSISFTGFITDLDDGDGGGISLTNNNSAVITFSGGVVLSTGANPAFTATGAGLLQVCDENPCNGGATGSRMNKLTTTTGTALNVTNTLIGWNNLEFRSISVDGDDSAPANGIVLNNTGPLGGLKVKGMGSVGSGGTIQDASGHGISLTRTEAVSLNRMNITSNLGSGIGGLNVNGLVLSGCGITVNGDDTAADESGVNITNLTGTVAGGKYPTSITNTTISNNFEFELQITNDTATALANLQMSGNTISADGTQLNHGNLVNFLAIGASTTNMTLNVTSSSFTGNTDTSGGRIVTGTGVQCDHSGTGGTMNCNVSGATFTNNNVGLQASVAAGGQMVLGFNLNRITGSRSNGINIFADANAPFTKSIRGRIENNSVGTFGVPNSGAQLGPGVRVQNEGSVPVTLLIGNNTISNTQSFQGIDVNVGISTASALGGAATNLTIFNNSFYNIGNRAIAVQDNDVSTSTKPTVCVDLSSNFFGAGIVGQAGDGSWVHLRELNGTFKVRQASPTVGANSTELDDRQDNGNDATGTKYAIGGTPQFNQPACLQP